MLIRFFLYWCFLRKGEKMGSFLDFILKFPWKRKKIDFFWCSRCCGLSAFDWKKGCYKFKLPSVDRPKNYCLKCEYIKIYLSEESEVTFRFPTSLASKQTKQNGLFQPEVTAGNGFNWGKKTPRLMADVLEMWWRTRVGGKAAMSRHKYPPEPLY